MKRITVLAAVVVAALAVVGAAQAGNPDGLGPWADYVVANNQGCAIEPPNIVACVPVPPSRTNPQAAVGPAESPTGPNQNIPVGSFYSLGFTDPSTGPASITLGFDNAICNQPGTDLAIDIFEITQEPYPNETVNVYVSKENVNYVFAGTVTKDGTVSLPAGFGFANFVKLVDATPRGPFATTTIVADGYDLDGVRSLSTLPCDTGTGKVEICKASTNGMSGKLFQYSINGGAAISVRGGRCSGPITTPAGAVRIVELPSDPPSDLVKVTTRPANRLVLTDLPNRTAIVFVQPGSTAANETMVTFTNQPAGGNYGDLKICKLTESPVYLGRGFSFSVNGGPLITTEANDAFSDPSTWSCRLAGRFQVGTRLTVKEQIPAGAEVAWIDTDPGDRLLDLNTADGSALVLIGAGVTTLLVDNEPIPPAQSGWIEICKHAALVPGGMVESVRPGEALQLLRPDPEVKGLFTFTVTPSDGNSFDVQAGVGQCTEPIRVAAGVARVTEHQQLNHTLEDIFTLPEDRLLDSNLINGTADVEIPVAASSNDETQVHFVNSRDRAQLKVCKALGPGSDALSGQEFVFSVVDLDGFQRDPLNPRVTASSAGTQCVIVGEFPVGHNVQVAELLGHGPGDAGEFINTTGEGTVTIAPGVNSITVTNTAVGLLEICKAPIADLGRTTTQPTFAFRVDGGSAIQVQAGKCSPPKRVSVGNHTVQELNTQQYYELDPNAPGGGITAFPADREVAKNLPNRTITVSVPYGAQGETLVTFYNRIKRGMIKICKTVSIGSLDAIGTTQFGFNYTVNGGQPIFAGTAANGECILVSPDYPVLQPNGQPTVILVQEVPVAGVYVSDITYTGSGTVIGLNTCGGTIQYQLGSGVNITTFNNVKGPRPTACD